MKLVLVRHGRSEANARQVLAGRAPGVELDAVGRAQAEALREPFAGLEISASYHSPMLRCLQTAQFAGLNPVAALEGLNECDYGEWTNRPLSELAGEPLWKEIQQRPSDAEFPGGESMARMNRRILDTGSELRARHAGGQIVVAVTHGDPIKALLADALAMDFDQFQRIHVAPGSVSIVDYSHERPFVLCINGEHTALAQLAVVAPTVGGGDSPRPSQ